MNLLTSTDSVTFLLATFAIAAVASVCRLPACAPRSANRSNGRFRQERTKPLEIVMERQFTETIGLVVREGAQLIAFGLILAIPGIDLAGRAIQGLLIGVSPFDIPTITAVAIGLAGVALLACYLAARRVTTVDLERVLRDGG